jgi:NAD(P)H-binding
LIGGGDVYDNDNLRFQRYPQQMNKCIEPKRSLYVHGSDILKGDCDIIMHYSMYLIAILLLHCTSYSSHALQSPGSGNVGGASTVVSSTTTPIPVLVSGASGRTGQLVFSALLQDPRYHPKALVRTEKSAKKLQKAIPETQLDQIFICDVTKLQQEEQQQPLLTGVENCQALVICTSAVPIISKLSLVRAFLKVPFNLIRGRKAIDFRSYNGQVAQIDFAKKMKIPHVVVVGSMGGTDTNNFLNRVGKTTLKNGTETGNGDILVWKRKAERYLVNSGLDYTIIHPGGLIDTPAGVEEYVLDVNDVLLNNTKRSISREDVANLCVAAISLYRPGQTKIALDCITRPLAVSDVSIDGDGTTTTPKVSTATEALEHFLKQGKVYNYEL